jgi:hypothetical protein
LVEAGEGKRSESERKPNDVPKTQGRARNVKQRDEPEIDGFLSAQCTAHS